MVDDDGGDLPEVMREIVELMGAKGATLTLHPEGQRPSVLFCHPSIKDSPYRFLLAECHHVAASLLGSELLWRQHDMSPTAQAAMLPVQRVPGHSRLVITIVFERPDAVLKARVEAIHAGRTAFAIGYFRLWQLDRLHKRRYQALEAAINCTQIGVVLIDRSARIIFASEAAENILAAGNGLGSANGRLRACHMGDAVNLQAALMHVAGRDAEMHDERNHAPLLAFRRRDAPSLIATVIPMRSSALEPGDVAATIYLVDPQLDTEATLGPLCRLFGLSPVETRLVCYLAAGDIIATAAEKMHIREQTARGYLKQIFVKTGTNRQTELMILMLSSLLRMKTGLHQEALTETAADVALAHFA